MERVGQPIDEDQRLQDLAASLDCLTETDFALLAGVKPTTAEAWRKRGQGPAYVRLGTRYFYPRQAIAAYLQSVQRTRRGVSDLL